MTRCDDCIFFRRPLPPSVLLNEALGGTDSATAAQLTKVAEDERQVRDEEVQLKRLAAARGAEEWGQAPRMSNYCGLRESVGTYLLHEIKNAGAKCDDFEAGPRPSRTCETCRHRKPATGLETDVAVAQMIGRTGLPSLVGQTGSWGGDQGMSSYLQGVGPRRAQEAYLAYTTAGRLPTEPEYLDWCDRYSDPAARDYAVCALTNAHRACPGWAPVDGAAGSGSQPGGAAGDVAETTISRWDLGGFTTCGDHRFFLDNVQLVVELPAAAGEKPEHVRFDVSSWPQCQWVRLNDTGGNPLPVLAMNHRGTIKLKVGAVDEPAARGVGGHDPRAPFRVEAYVFYKHPDYDYQLSFETHNGQLIVMDPPMVNSNIYDYPRIDVRRLREGRWETFTDSRGNSLPLRLQRTADTVLCEWLP